MIEDDQIFCSNCDQEIDEDEDTFNGGLCDDCYEEKQAELEDDFEDEDDDD